MVERYKTRAFGNKSLKTLGPLMWNSLPEKIKMQKIDHEDFSLHTPFPNSFLSNCILFYFNFYIVHFLSRKNKKIIILLLLFYEIAYS